MKLRALPSLFLLRTLTRELHRIGDQLTRQTELLARLADHVAPLTPVTDRETVAQETGVDYVDPIDQALIQDFVRRTEGDLGHHPTDDEILSYLADEKTVDLHRRLLERDRERERRERERRF